MFVRQRSIRLPRERYHGAAETHFDVPPKGEQHRRAITQRM